METQKNSSDGEDIPSDFFDDFGKEEFIEGLSVIDSWDDDDNQNKCSRINLQNIDSVRDLRELIVGESKQDIGHCKALGKRGKSSSYNRVDDFIKPGMRRDLNKTNEAIKKDKEMKFKEYLSKHLDSKDDLRPPGTELDDFFEGRRSEESKKCELKKHLIETPVSHEWYSRPKSPIEPNKYIRKRKSSPFAYNNLPRKVRDSPGRYVVSPGAHVSAGRHCDTTERHHASPGRHLVSPGRHGVSPGRHGISPGRYGISPRRHRESSGRHHESSGKNRESPTRFHKTSRRLRESPGRHHEPSGRFRESPGRHRDSSDRHRRIDRYEDQNIKHHHSPNVYRNSNRSPRREHDSYKNTSYRNERKYRPSPRASPGPVKMDRYSRSPQKRYGRTTVSSRYKATDDFLYPSDVTTHYSAENPTYDIESKPSYSEPTQMVYNVGATGGTGPSTGPLVDPGFNYSQVPAYGGYNVPFEYVSQPNLPLPIPAPQPVPAPVIPQLIQGTSDLVPTPEDPSTSHGLISSLASNTSTSGSTILPSDALAKLVAEGKLSHEDYLKLAPNKGVVLKMDSHKKLGVINRCHSALTKLGDLVPPNRLKIGKIMEEPKAIAPKFCSPLKRQQVVEFNFTKTSGSAIALQNKHIIDTIVSTLDLNKFVSRPKKNLRENMRDVAVQTWDTHCDMCLIRKSTLINEVGTSIDREHFTSTIHTQVVEKDLLNSKSVFNPSGSVADGAPISIAHMTPAQLVSQLAARAKTLKQNDGQQSNQYNNRAHYDGRGDYNYRNNYTNYRY